jgi:energy-converting hydrogenase Eha subunit E
MGEDGLGADVDARWSCWSRSASLAPPWPPWSSWLCGSAAPGGDQRQQLKWFLSGAALAALAAFGPAVGPTDAALVVRTVLTSIPIPVAVGIAILRYRLYDIDRLINRTLVHGLLTAVLGLGYAAGSLLFALVAGAGSNPPSWLVAGATLAAAAAIRPARRRIQATVAVAQTAVGGLLQ